MGGRKELSAQTLQKADAPTKSVLVVKIRLMTTDGSTCGGCSSRVMCSTEAESRRGETSGDKGCSSGLLLGVVSSIEEERGAAPTPAWDKEAVT